MTAFRDNQTPQLFQSIVDADAAGAQINVVDDDGNDVENDDDFPSVVVADYDLNIPPAAMVALKDHIRPLDDDGCKGIKLYCETVSYLSAVLS